MNPERVPVCDLDPELAELVPSDQLAAAQAVALAHSGNGHWFLHGDPPDRLRG